MIDKFQAFSDKVEHQYNRMAAEEGELYTVDLPNIFDIYLEAFPKGTNPVFRERTEHDCSCCKNFVRHLGNVVKIRKTKKDGFWIETIWDVEGLPYPYDEVAVILGDHIRASAINGVFRSKEASFGNKKTYERVAENVKTWHHFYGKVNSKHRLEKGSRTSADQINGDVNTKVKVVKRGLEEIDVNALRSISDLIKEKVLYRGEEFAQVVSEYTTLKVNYDKVPDDQKMLYVWFHRSDRSALFRNTVIGTLAQDLTKGDDLESAVRSFELKVAPTNYKRPKALITKKMVDSALATLKENNLDTAIERRLAKLSDVSVNDVLFVDNTVKSVLKGGHLEELLLSSITKKDSKVAIAHDITGEEFFKRVVPGASNISIYLSGDHLNNFVTLTAPVHDDVAPLFKWDNNFSWSYDGDVTDSIKERVKRAGGNVSGKLRVSLAWFNKDDLDIHVHEPNRNHIYFGNKSGKLDVDMNVASPVRDAVENVTWTDSNLADGEYRVVVHNYNQRETDNVGFLIEVEYEGNVRTYSFDSAVGSRSYVDAITFSVKKGKLVEIKESAGVRLSGSATAEKWGLTTNTLVPVDILLLSPNYWGDNKVGNKHWFFILRGCKNPEPVRGIYNEYLRPSLDKHRKVFEVLGAKTKCPVADEQLSGVGFSSTRHDTVTAHVTTGNRTTAYNITF